MTAFSAAVDQVTDQLGGVPTGSEQTRRAAQFARLHVATGVGLQLDVDLGVDKSTSTPSPPSSPPPWPTSLPGTT